MTVSEPSCLPPKYVNDAVWSPATDGPARSRHSRPPLPTFLPPIVRYAYTWHISEDLALQIALFGEIRTSVECAKRALKVSSLVRVKHYFPLMFMRTTQDYRKLIPLPCALRPGMRSCIRVQSIDVKMRRLLSHRLPEGALTIDTST